MTTFKAVSYDQFHSIREFCRGKSCPNGTVLRPSWTTRLVWTGWLGPGSPFFPLHWTVFTTDAGQSGWGGVPGSRSAQRRWTLEEAHLPIDVLELQAIRLSLEHWTDLLWGFLVRIQLDNTALAFVNHQGGTRSASAALEAGRVELSSTYIGSALHKSLRVSCGFLGASNCPTMPCGQEEPCPSMNSEKGIL